MGVFFVPWSAIPTLFLTMVLIRTLTLTQVADIPHSQVAIRPYGDPQEALERIERDNFTTIDQLDQLAADLRQPELQRMVYEYAPLMLLEEQRFQDGDDTFIGVYYLASQTSGEETTVITIQYFFFATDESGGTLIRERLAYFGHPIDREMIYRLTIIDGRIASAHFQAPGHELVRFPYSGDARPVFEIASANNNFRLVGPEELERRRGYQIIVPMPHHEHSADPAHDPDFVALAAREALLQHDIDMADYIYIEFQNPVHDGLVTLSAKVQGRWYYLHESVAGLHRAGYNEVGIYVGFSVRPGDIEEIWATAYTDGEFNVEVISVYLYPKLVVAA